jgi:hypothetical protein
LLAQLGFDWFVGLRTHIWFLLGEPATETPASTTGFLLCCFGFFGPLRWWLISGCEGSGMRGRTIGFCGLPERLVGLTIFLRFSLFSWS